MPTVYVKFVQFKVCVATRTTVGATATSMLQTTSQKSTTAVLTYKRNEIYKSSYHDRSE